MMVKQLRFSHYHTVQVVCLASVVITSETRTAKGDSPWKYSTNTDNNGIRTPRSAVWCTAAIPYYCKQNQQINSR